MSNPFDQFDVSPSTNPFDQFDDVAEKVKPEESTWDALKRGATESFQQIPQLAQGVKAGIGAAGEAAFGEGGMFTDIKKSGVEGFEAWGDKIEEKSQQADSIDYSWGKAKEGDFGSLVNWISHGLGYVGGQAIQTLATGGIGALGGKFVAGTAAKQIAEGMVAKEVATLTAANIGKEIAEDQILKAATANVASKFATIGATTALAANATGMEGGEIFGGLTSENKDRPLTGSELGKAFASTLAAGGLEFVGDKLGLDLMLGKSKFLKPAETMTGMGGRAARGLIAAGAAAPIEAGTEYFQTGLEEFGKGKEENILPFNQSEEAQKQAREGAALGAFGGAVMGGAAGALRGAKPKADDILKTDNIDDAIAVSQAVLDAGSDWQKLGIGPADGSLDLQRAGQAYQDMGQQTGESLDAQRRDASIAEAGQRFQDLGITQPADDLAAQKRISEVGSQWQDIVAQQEAQLEADRLEQQARIDRRMEGGRGLIDARDQRIADVGAQAKPIIDGLEADQAELDSLVEAETRNKQVLQAQLDQERIKQTQIDQMPGMARAATLDAPTAMQSAFERLRKPEPPPVQAEPTPTPAQPAGVSTSEPRIVERTPSMVAMPQKLADMTAARTGGEVVRILNQNGKFAFTVIPKAQDGTPSAVSAVSANGAPVQRDPAIATVGTGLSDRNESGVDQARTNPADMVPSAGLPDGVPDAAVDAARLKMTQQLLADNLKTNPGSASAPIWQSKLAEIDAQIGPIVKEAPKQQEKTVVDRTGWSEPKIKAVDFYTSLRSSDADTGVLKRQLRALAKTIPSNDEDAVSAVDMAATRLWGTDYDPKVSNIEFAQPIESSNVQNTATRTQPQATQATGKETQDVGSNATPATGVPATGVAAGPVEANGVTFTHTVNDVGNVKVNGDPAAIRSAFPGLKSTTFFADGKPAGVMFGVTDSPTVIKQLTGTTNEKAPEAQQTTPQQPEAPAAGVASTYINGDKADYTGVTQDIHGGKFYEVKFTEGAKKGQTAVTQRAPDGTNPAQQSTQQPTGIVTPQIVPASAPAERYPASPVGSAANGYRITGGEAFSPQERLDHAEKQRGMLVSESKALRTNASIAPNTGSQFEVRNNKAKKAETLLKNKRLIEAWDKEIATAKSMLPVVVKPKKKPAGTRNLRAAGYDKNPLMTFLATHGLYHLKGDKRSQKTEFSPDKAIMVSGYGPVFKRTGKHPSDLVVNAIQEGYLPNDGTVKQLEDMIRRAISGEKISPMYAEGVAEQIAQERIDAQPQFEDFMDSDIDPFGDLDYSEDDAQVAGYNELEDPIKAEVNALLAQAEALGIDTEEIKLDASYATQDQSEQAYYEAARDALKAAIEESNRSDSANDGAQSNAGEQGGQKGADTSAVEGDSQPTEAAPSAEVTANQAKIDEATSLKYPLPYLAKLIKEEKLDPQDAFHMHLLDNALPASREYNRLMIEHNGDFSGIEFSDDRYPNKYAFVLPDASEQGKWRISYFDKHGLSSHHVENTQEKAQQTLVTEHFTVNAKGTLDKFAATNDWARGTEYAGLIQKMNSGELTLAQFSEEQRKLNAKYDALDQGLTAPTRADVLAQQEQAENAQALDDKAQIDAEASRQTLTAQTAPEQRTDTSGDMFGEDKAALESAKREADAVAKNEAKKDPNQAGMFDEPQAAVPATEMTAADHLREAARITDEQSPAKRFEIGKALTSEQRKSVLKTLVDVYKAKGAPKESKGQDQSGNERFGYAYSPELFEKSDITGAMVRYHVTLPDGRIAHPSELFEGYTQADIDQALINQDASDKADTAEQASIEDRANRYAKPTKREAAQSYMQRNMGTQDPADGGPAFVFMEKDGGIYATKEDDTALIERMKRAGWRAMDAEKAAPVAQEPTKPAATAKIDDFGEKLKGARKDYAALMKDATDVDITAEPLSKSWPEPDYQKLLDGGADPFVVAWVRASRDEIPTKPQKGWKLSTWAAQVKLLRDVSFKLLNGDITKEKLEEKLKQPETARVREHVGSRAELYQAVGHEKSLKGVTFLEHHYSLYKGEKNVRKWVIEAPAKATAFGNFPREIVAADTHDEALSEFKKKYADLDIGAKAKANPGFILYGKRGQKGTWIGKKIGREYIDLKRFDDVKEARAYREENTDALEAMLAKYKETPYERNEENAPRVGGDHRNGAPVTPEVFSETFGFRGVQFGNYVEQGRRQSDLNEAFDALMDMAAVLGIPPRAISLNGRLGLAFGARGKGGKNAPAAHYESGNMVINLTKGGGPGSLAHEWFHSMDNYFAQLDGGEGGYMTGGASGDKVRSEMLAAFSAIKRSIQAGALKIRSAELDKRRSKPYWATPIEMAARSFESYIIAKLQDQNASNDYLANVISQQAWDVSESFRIGGFNENGQAATYPYPTVDEMPAIRAAFDDFFKTVETKETDTGIAMYSRMAEGITRREALIAAIAAAAGTQAQAGTTLGKATPLSAAVMSQQVSPAVAKVLRGNGATNPNGAKALRTALEMIALTGPVELRQFAKQIGKLLPKDGFMLTVDDKGLWNAHGAVKLNPIPHLMLFTAEGRTGLTYETFLHETLHLIVAAKYHSLSSGGLASNFKKLKMSNPGAMPEMEQLLALWNEFESVAKERIGSITDKEMKLTLSEAMGNPDEFFVRALTEPRFQQFLSGIEYKGKTLLQRFKDWIKTSLFGFKSEGVAPSWLDAALLASNDFMSKSEGDTADFGTLGAMNAFGSKQQNSTMFSRASQEGKSGVLSPDGKFKAWPQTRNWNRAEYEDVVSLLPEGYRNDPHRREPLPAKDWNLLAAKVAPELEALNDLIGVPGAFLLDSLGNITTNHNKAPGDVIINEAKEIADKYNIGMYITNVRIPFMQTMLNEGFTSEAGISMVVQRAARDTIGAGTNWSKAAELNREVDKSPLRSETESVYRQIPGNVMSYKPRGFGQAMFSRTEGASTPQTLPLLANQAPANALNATLARHFKDDKHVYRSVSWGRGSVEGDVREAVRAAFGARIEFVQSVNSEPLLFNGFNIPNQPKTLYVNVDGNVNFLSISGHELWHAIKRQRPDLIEWYRENSRQYYKDVDAYKNRLNTQLQKGEAEYTTNSAEEELEADFLGDSLTDAGFLQALADASPAKFKSLLNNVILWLGKMVNKLKGLKSENEVNDVKALQGYLRDVLVAFAEGKDIPAPLDSGVKFSRSAMKSIDANIRRGLDALAKALNEKTTVHRAMFRNGLGWVDFVWGDTGTVKPSGKTKGAMGLSHIIEARQRKDGLNDEQVSNLLNRIVTTIAEGSETVRREVESVINVTIAHNGVEVVLIRNKGSNTWLMNGWHEKNPDANGAGYVASNATSSKSTTAQRGEGAGFSEIVAQNNDDVKFSRSQPQWDKPVNSTFDDLVYKLQDKQIDTKRVIQSIKEASKSLADDKDVYLQEELFHGRAAARTEDFVNKELGPLINDMKMRGIDIPMLDEYLHARHAQEANELIAGRNPDIQDGGSGMTTKAAKDYLAKLPTADKKRLEAVAAKVDAILAETRQLYADYSLESQTTVDGWGAMFDHYVPLMREDKDGGMGIGQGFSIKGKETKGRTGSTRKVVDILANIAMQREKAIVRGEKNRVATALVGLVDANPNSEFWRSGPPPTEKVYDPKTDSVVERTDPLYKSRDNVIIAKVKQSNGEVIEKAVTFNEDNERALRMARALKNLDAAQLEGVLGLSAKVTRYFSAINTQYNPVFGAVNLVRDFQGALLNLSSTPLKDHGKEVAGHTLSALKGIYLDARAARDGKTPTSAWAALWEEFQNEGGQTGYRDMFANSNDRAKAIERELNPTAWMDSPLGKIFTANGALKVPLSVAQEKASGIFGWLSDYNLAMENAVRLSAYKVGLEQGMSKQQAASLAKNLTVNFNRKGQVGQQAGALYAFFNAAVQGSARIGQTLFDMDESDARTIRLSSFGKKIVYGGVLLGTAQALLLAAAGFDDEDPPEFVRERSLIIPTGGKSYITIPMPLGLHVIPNLGRIPTEFALNGFKNPAKHITQLLGIVSGAFNPMGGGGSLVQMLSPTAIDPLVALSENKDWTGKPIAKVSFNKATPGHALARDTASTPAKWLSEAINYISGGTEYTAGVLSPTPDQIDYLWGQVTGGVGREIGKADQTAFALLSGEDLPTYKIPLVGRFYGNSDAQASQANKFYNAINKLNEHEAEIKGLRKDQRFDELAEYMKDNPEARLFTAANRVEREVQKLRQRKRELIAKDAPNEQVKAVESQITSRITRFNEMMKLYSLKKAA